MEHTFHNIHIHLIFAVSNRERLISREWKNELYNYMAGIIQNKGQHAVLINGDMDHVHLLIGMSPNISLSDLVRDIKANSSGFINQRKFIRSKFSWQRGYAAFSVGRSEMEKVLNYIENQEEHHRGKTLREEYELLLERYGISFDKKYLLGD